MRSGKPGGAGDARDHGTLRTQELVGRLGTDASADGLLRRRGQDVHGAVPAREAPAVHAQAVRSGAGHAAGAAHHLVRIAQPRQAPSRDPHRHAPPRRD